MAKVIVQFQGQEYAVELKDGMNVIGRSSRCSIPIRDLNTSREHCEIQFTNGACVLLDKGSMNGTRLNGKKVAASRLSPGDAIVIGQTTIYFEVKPAGAPEATPTTPPSPAADEGSVTSRRERDSEAKTAMAPSSAKPKTRPGVAPVKDYTVVAVTKRGFPVKGASIAAAVAVIALGVLFLRSLAGAKAFDDSDETNLVRANYSFEFPASEGVRGWTLPGPASSRISADLTSARHGKQALLIDKTAAASDLAVEVVTRDTFPLKGVARIEASAFAKTEGFGGNCYLKINWLAATGGPLLLEQASAMLPRPAVWQEITADFDVPPGAGAFTLALGAVGRAGRIWFDEVRLHAREGAAAPRASGIGPFTLAIAPNGVFDLSAGTRRLLSNVSLAIEMDKEGRIGQAFAQDTKVEATPQKIRIAGKLPSPADLRPVEFEIELVLVEGEVWVGARAWGENLRQADRLRWDMSVPRDAKLVGCAPAGGGGTPRVSVLAEDAGATLEYRDLVQAVSEGSRQRKLVHLLPIDPASGRAAVSFQLRVGGGASGVDPLKEARRIEGERDRPGEARRVLFDALRSVREPEVRDQVARELHRLDDLERTEWSALQSQFFLAWISRRPDLHAGVLEVMTRYRRRWDDGGTQGKAAELQTEIQKSSEEAQTAGSEERASRVLGEAKACLEKGRRGMAAAMFELVTSRYPATKSAAEAAELMKTLPAVKD